MNLRLTPKAQKIIVERECDISVSLKEQVCYS